MLEMCVGILSIISVIGVVLGSIAKTPDNLRGFYGQMFCTIAAVAIVGLVAVGLL